MVSTTTIKVIQDIRCKDVGVDGDAWQISKPGWMVPLVVSQKEK